MLSGFMHWVILIGGLGAPALMAQGAAATADPSRQRYFQALVTDDGQSLRSDHQGPYKHDEGRVRAGALNGIYFCTEASVCGTLPVNTAVHPENRSLFLDLSHPVQKSGAKSLGVLRSTEANFGAFWTQDKTRMATLNEKQVSVIKSVLDIPVGNTAQSDRVEIRFFAEGVQHILQFGPWTAGQYQTQQGAYNGSGTTPGEIQRKSDGHFIVGSPSVSIGRLWRNDNPANPIDLGLYEFSYRVEFTELPKP